MKKIFTFVAAMLATASLMAVTYTPEPGEGTLNSLRATLADGDTIVLADGAYYEWSSWKMDSSTPLPELTIIAAEGAHPSLALYNWQVVKSLEFNGVAISNISADNYLFDVKSSIDKLIFKNCSVELNANVTTPTPYLYLRENTVGTLTIDNCIFKTNGKNQGGVIYGGSATVTNFSMTNTTIYGIAGELAVWIGTCTTALVDHCTIYNAGTRPIYIASATSLTSCLVQNCIVACSEVPASNNYCIATYAGDVKNCMYYNINGPRSSDATLTGCQEANPLFVDAANGNFKLAATSPAINAGTDSKNLGDLRWGNESTGTELNEAVTPAAPAKVIRNGHFMINHNGHYIHAMGF